MVVFSSLANLSVPDFSDRCRIVIAEEGLGGYLIERPMPTEGASWIGSGLGPRLVRCDDKSGQLITGNTVRTPFVGPVVRGELGYHGVVMHLWDGGDRPSAEDAAMARVAVAHAVALIHEQRLAAQLLAAQLEDDDDDARDDARSRAHSSRQQCRSGPRPRLHIVRGDIENDADGADDSGVHSAIEDNRVGPHRE